MSENLIITIIKILFINVYILIINFKILNKDIKAREIIKIVLVSSIITIIYTVMVNYLDNIFMIIMTYFVQLIFLQFLIEKNKESLFITNLISNAIVYILFGISVLLESPIIMKMGVRNRVINLVCILIIEICIIFVCFKIRRFKHGLLFLQNTTNYDFINIIMINMSAIAILIYCLVGNYYDPSTRNLFVCFIIVGIIMIIMIQKTLTLYYKQKLLSKTIEDYKNELADKDEQIKKLSEEKYEISKLNHQFYNRQKALELKVQDLINDINIEAGNELAIVKQIDDLSKEYSKGLEGIKGLDKLSSTDVEEIDDMFKYMQAECKKNDIDFKLQINGNINHMINKIIQKNKLETLIGDHIRDAIIAINAGNNKFRSILTILGIKDDCYELCIYDSGVEFTIDTLLKLGIEPTTTHRDTGGSGIGFMTTFETMKETKASLIINEKSTPSVNDYTKAVTIRFDGKNEYRICSYREDKIKKKTKDNRIIICNQNRSI